MCPDLTSGYWSGALHPILRVETIIVSLSFWERNWSESNWHPLAFLYPAMAGLQLHVVLLVMFLLVCQRLNVAGDCTGRTVHVNESGIITDGMGDYNKRTICEWLITGEQTSPMGGTMCCGHGF